MLQSYGSVGKQMGKERRKGALRPPELGEDQSSLSYTANGPVSCGYSSGGKSTTRSVKSSGKSCKRFFKKTTSSLIKDGGLKMHSSLASSKIRRTQATGKEDRAGTPLTGIRRMKPESMVSRSVALSGIGSEKDLLFEQ